MESLKNYNEVIDTFDQIKHVFENYNNQFVNESIEFLQFIESNRWGRVFYNAKCEIECLLLNNSMTIQRKIQYNHDRHFNWIEKIRIINNIDCADEKLSQYALTFPNSKYDYFCTIKGRYLSFINPIIKTIDIYQTPLTNINLEEMEQKKDEPTPETLFDIMNSASEETELDDTNKFKGTIIENIYSKFQNKLNEKEFDKLLNAFDYYFKNNEFQTLDEPINFTGKINKKSFGWELNRILDKKQKSVTTEVLRFVKNNISIYKDEKFKEENFRESNFYKYLTTKVQ